jgi:hypothetical protein
MTLIHLFADVEVIMFNVYLFIYYSEILIFDYSLFRSMNYLIFKYFQK